MLTQSLPRSAERYAADQRTEIAAAVAAVRRQWRRMTPEFDVSWQSIEPSVVAITATAQRRVAQGAAEYVPAVLAETGQTRAVAPFAAASWEPLIGAAGDGRPVDSLLYGAVTGAKSAVAAGASPVQALGTSGIWLTQAVGTVLSDTGRQSESLAMGVRPVGGYVRMLNPPSCARCVVLAGKWYRKNEGFLRHPACDCRHIPAAESVAGNLTVSPQAYFESLSAAEQDRIFGKAGAEAIRADANIGQVVNARRGMRTAQIGGRDVLITSEGTTRRGVAYRAMNTDRATDIRPSGRYFQARRPRLMPETIQQVATDRADYLRLLNANGYMAFEAPRALAVARLPGIEWRGLSRGEILARSNGSVLGNRVAAKTREVYVSGNKSVAIEASLTRAQTRAFLDDVAGVLDKTQSTTGHIGVSFVVPTGDHQFLRRKTLIGGYVVQGQPTVFINPKVASGARDVLTSRQSATLMPAESGIGYREYSITHELGHVVDNTNLHTYEAATFTPSGFELPNSVRDSANALHQEYYGMLSDYGKTRPTEGYAEVFAQWVHGSSDPMFADVVDAYARRYGWTR